MGCVGEPGGCSGGAWWGCVCVGGGVGYIECV